MPAADHGTRHRTGRIHAGRGRRPAPIGPGYCLQPQGPAAAKPYVLLLGALRRASKVALATSAWHGRERLGPLRVRGEVIALDALLRPDEIRDPAPAAPAPARPRPGRTG
ncbi:Ku protein [Streptomyces sp. NPDC001508]|uniref:Ku protein n=1 Tax=Streptomyces sp. NPDC001508 TaxID=3154656 RepID=UPI00331A60E7